MPIRGWQLRSLPAVVAACLGGLNFATTQRLDLKHPLVAQGRFVVGALGPSCRFMWASGPLFLFRVTRGGFSKVASLSTESLARKLGV